jgi:hypothetical protein
LISYYSLADQNKAFHKKEGLFTKLVDHKLSGSSLQNKFLRKNFNKEEETSQILPLQNSLTKCEPLITGESYINKDKNSFPFTASRNTNQSNDDYSTTPISSRRIRNISGIRKSFIDKYENNKNLMPQGLGKMNYFAKAQKIIEDHNLYRLKDYVMKDSPVTNKTYIDK